MTDDLAIPLEEIRAARERIVGAAVRTPLARLNVDDAPAEIYLKLENLQPIGSFKLHGAGNAMRAAPPERLKDGVWTASTGNMGQGVAWCARELGIESTIVVPDRASEAKLAAMTRLGARLVQVPFGDWFDIAFNGDYPGMTGLFIHPCTDRMVIAGNGTIGLEIVEDLPDVDAIVVPYGGGGLSTGVASAMRALKPDTSIYLRLRAGDRRALGSILRHG